MFLEENLVRRLETPCIVVDVARAQQNIREMQAVADSCGCKLRPHIKTHKMPLFVQMQLAAGAAGITCAKVSEAEVMADGGARDIFIAYPMVGDFRIRRAIALAGRLDRLILAVDSMACAKALDEAAGEAGLTLEVRLEVDTGAKRTGVVREHCVELAAAVAKLPHLQLTGIYTFKSLLLRDQPTEDNVAAAQEEGEIMQKLADSIRAAGVAPLEVSAGSTPTGAALAKTGLVDEIRPGTYIFKDHMLCKENVGRPEEIAVRYYATVVSTPAEDYAIIDGGTKTFPMDIPLDAPPYHYPGYALVEGREDLALRRMNEEHGILVSSTGKTGLEVGQKLALIPIHVCTAINLQNQVYLYEDGDIRLQAVAARGMLV